MESFWNWTKMQRKVIRKTILSIENKVYKVTGKIGGPGIVVEIDQSKFGKVKYHRVGGVCVFYMVERTLERKVTIIPVRDRKATTFNELLTKYVQKDSIIHSDYYTCFSRLKEYFAEYKTVNHSKNLLITLITATQIQQKEIGRELKALHQQDAKLKKT